MSQLTFKQFLLEGGKATEKFGTSRANKADIVSALTFVSKYTKIPVTELIHNLTGSTRLTYSGKQKDSGDIDIVVNETLFDKENIVKKLTAAVKHNPHITGGNVYSFAVPVHDGKKVQVDLMFVPDIEWAKFSHYSSEHSEHKSGVRNELLHSALKFSLEPNKDLRVKDKDGNDIVRASRAYKLDKGVERIFKIAPMRKDGKGRLKGTIKATPNEVQDVLDSIGHTGKFSNKAEIITDPEGFAKMLFGANASASDLLSTEQLITMIKKYKRKDADKIFKDAVRGMKHLNFDVPAELKQFE